MGGYHNNNADEGVLIPLLARRSYHLPGNGWWSDWFQWLRNNHILLGICFHHPLHPLETWERCLFITASISFGLVATGTVYYLQLFHSSAMEQELVTLPFQGVEYRITHGMIALWTLGGVCHSIFDMLVWHVMACACCHPGGRYATNTYSRRCKDAGSWSLVPIILVLLVLAGYFVLLQAAQQQQGRYEDDDDYNNNVVYGDDGYVDQELQNVDLDNIDGAKDFAFLIQNGIELILAWFVYFPVIGTILFSGLLGCNGRLPILGGRPRDIRILAAEARASSSNYRKM